MNIEAVLAAMHAELAGATTGPPGEIAGWHGSPGLTLLEVARRLGEGGPELPDAQPIIAKALNRVSGGLWGGS